MTRKKLPPDRTNVKLSPTGKLLHRLCDNIWLQYEPDGEDEDEEKIRQAALAVLRYRAERLKNEKLL